VVGVHDALEGVAFCPPKGIKLRQIVGIVKKYVKDNPDRWNRPAGGLVTTAIAGVFPCRKR
jgi:hypothetical protein